jgi:hypothetical protein
MHTINSLSILGTYIMGVHVSNNFNLVKDFLTLINIDELLPFSSIVQSSSLHY